MHKRSSALEPHAPEERGGLPTNASQDCARAPKFTPKAGRLLREDLLAQRLALDAAAIVAITDTKGRITYVNEKFCAISGYERSELLGSDHRILNSGQHHPDVFREMYRTIARGGIWRGELCNRAKSGALYWVDTIVVPRLDARNKPTAYVSIRFDITARKTAEASLAAHRSLIELMIDRVDEGICMLNPKGGIAFYNARFGELHGVSGRSKTHREQIETALADLVNELPAVRSGEAVVRNLPGGRSVAVDRHEMPAGDLILFCRALPLMSDVPEAAPIAPPRRRPRAGQALAPVADALGATASALHLLGVDHFTSIEECHGRRFGDKVLRVLRKRLGVAAGAEGRVFGLGGGEIAVVQHGERDEQAAARFAARMLASISEKTVTVDGLRLTVGASAGICLNVRHGLAPADAVRQARLALVAAKRRERGSFAFYQPDLNLQVQARQSLERDLRDALKRRQFVVYYQPILDARSGSIVSAEALVRWQHPERGLVAAGDFIPIAEETGLISEIGDEVLRQACHDAMLWSPEITVAVNLSAVQFRRGRVSNAVEAALAASGLPAHRLELEITESALLEVSYQNLQTLHQLRAQGIRIALDDFGTGFSSLSYLQVFPFDKIKIDRSFVSNLGSRSERASAIVRAITSLADVLKMVVVAEGVEQPEQHREAVQAGCGQVQGYLFGKPRPQAEIIEVFRASESVSHGSTLSTVDLYHSDQAWTALVSQHGSI